MTDVIATKNETQQPRIDSLYVRGSQIRMVLLPESLTETPIYKDMGAREVEQSFRGRPRGRGGPRGRGRGMGRGGEVEEEAVEDLAIEEEVGVDLMIEAEEDL